MILPVALCIVTMGGLAVKSWKDNRANRIPKRTLTQERADLLNRTLNTTNLPPEEIRKVAAAFGAEGFKDEEKLLIKRAALRELPQEVKQARREVFRKAMRSTDKQKVMQIADVFEREGSVGSANSLRKYAAGLE